MEAHEESAIYVLRHAAAVQYITSQTGVTTRELSVTPPFSQVSQMTLERWCAEDNWVIQRQDYFDKIKEEIQIKISSTLVEARSKQLKSLDGIYEEMVDAVMDKEVKVRSKEGAAVAAVKIMEASDTLRDKISKEVFPEQIGSRTDISNQVIPQLTEDEARAAAKTIIQQRRAKLRQAIASKKEADEAEEDEDSGKARLHVLEGD